MVDEVEKPTGTHLFWKADMSGDKERNKTFKNSGSFGC